MKFKMNRAFREASGELDGLVYRVQRGKVVVSRKPDLTNVDYSENQIAHRERFKKATVYGRSVMANPTQRALYQTAADERDLPIFAVTIADYFNLPIIHEVDLSAYNGHVGSHITINATDDFSVKNVHVSLTNSGGMPLENGDAVETSSGSGIWVYNAKFNVPADTLVTVRVVATDNPGGAST